MNAPERLRVLACAVVAYDEAISSCANDARVMTSFCTTEGEDLDVLYFRFVTLAREALTDPEALP